MNLQTYRQQQALYLSQQPLYRERCWNCRQPSFSCYCAQVEPFDPCISFVILIHPLEVRRRIATGRMSHLFLKNSFLLQGEDFSQNKTVNHLVQAADRHCLLLYPGPQATNLSHMSKEARQYVFSQSIPPQKQLTLFVIDGTWATARKMARSENLRPLPRVCFTPDRPSNFRVRKQPAQNCFSTIEAIHQTIEFVAPARGFDLTSRAHDRLLGAFDKMVDDQLSFVRQPQNPRIHHE